MARKTQDFSAWSKVVQDSKSIVGPKYCGDTLFTLAKKKAESLPDEIAFFSVGGGGLSYRQIFEKACKLAVSLKMKGIKQGDVVSMQLPNWGEAAVINVAVSGLGAIVNPIPAIYRSSEVGAILKDAKSKILFVPKSFRSIDYESDVNKIRSSLPELIDVVYVRCEGYGHTVYENLLLEGEGVAFEYGEVDPYSAKLLLYTSGTTGRPKGVLHSHAALRAWPSFLMSEWGLGDGDVMFMPSPITHVTGYAFGLELPFITPVRTALLDHWSASAAIGLIDETGATACVGATPFLKELIDIAEHSGCRLDTMKIFGCGGASVPPDLIYRVRAVTKACHAFRVYGSTEVPMVTRGFPGPNEVADAAETDGKIAGYEVKIISLDTGLEIASNANETGEILARGPAMMIGYTDPAENEKAFDSEGYFLTGDVGYISENNALTVTGRKKDIIIRGGENLSPKEIEDMLGSHPAIDESAVVGIPHARLGEGVCAFLRVREGAVIPSLGDISDFLEKKGLARQKFPERIEYVEEFPRTPSGKIKKDLLRKRFT